MRLFQKGYFSWETVYGPPSERSPPLLLENCQYKRGAVNRFPGVLIFSKLSEINLRHTFWNALLPFGKVQIQREEGIPQGGVKRFPWFSSFKMVNVKIMLLFYTIYVMNDWYFGSSRMPTRNDFFNSFMCWTVFLITFYTVDFQYEKMCAKIKLFDVGIPWLFVIILFQNCF